MNSEIYGDDFFNSLFEGSDIKSKNYKKYYLPMLKQITEIESMVDVGCGIGVLLKSAIECGIEEVIGIDPYNGGELLQIPQDRFLSFDLSKIDEQYDVLINMINEKKFDLAACLEVGEHLPDYCANNLVRFLTSCSNLVFFSAAIPGQCGDGHINEQWPIYWEKIFKKYGYVRVDYFRKKLWNEYEIEGYYRQNICLYVKEDKLQGYPLLKKFIEDGENDILPKHMVHPTVYNYSIKHYLEEFHQERYPRVDISKENISNTKVLLNREEILEKMPKGGVMAEVGVAYGDFSLEMIRICKPKKIYCIDIWEMEERWSRFNENMKEYIDSGLVEVMKGDSIDMLRKIPDGSLDFVYIDAMHDYEHPRRELNICKDKIKKNGFISGDDYVVLNIFEKPIMQYGVVNAVNEFMVNEHFEMIYLTLDNLFRTPSYCLKKIQEG